MNINKNPWIIAEKISFQQLETLKILAKLAGFKFFEGPKNPYYPWMSVDLKIHCFVACKSRWLYGTNDYPLEAHQHISYERVIEKMKLIIKNNNAIQNKILKNKTENHESSC